MAETFNIYKNCKILSFEKSDINNFNKILIKWKNFFNFEFDGKLF